MILYVLKKLFRFKNYVLMTKKYFTLILVTIFFNCFVCSAEASSSKKKEKIKEAIWNTGNDDIRHMKAKNSNYKKGRDALKQAMKHEKKGKNIKANKRFNDAINFFTLAFEENPEDLDILNNLGFCLNKIKDFAMAEIYYSQGLDIDPKHKEINGYLGQLYVETNRVDKAKERLKVLENCKCDEFETLKIAIKESESKY